MLALALAPAHNLTNLFTEIDSELRLYQQGKPYRLTLGD
jgi:hypothetical protein